VIVIVLVVKLLLPVLTADDAHRLFGIGTDRFLIL
jgi:hypothetical protein